MKKFKQKFRVFAKERMKTQGNEIRKWAKLDNPLYCVVLSGTAGCGSVLYG